MNNKPSNPDAVSGSHEERQSVRQRKRRLGGGYRRGKVWWIQFSHLGRVQRESSGSTRHADAVALLRRRQSEIETRGAALGVAKARISFPEAMRAVERDYEKNHHRSLEDLSRRITKHLVPHFGSVRLATIDTTAINAYVGARLEAGAAAATVNRELAIVKRSFRLAEIARPKIAMLRENNVRKGFFEPDQIAAVVAHLPAALKGVIEFAAITGWRISEVLALEWRQILATEVRLDPGTTKNAEGRTFPITAALRVVLDTQARDRDALRQQGVVVARVFTRNGRPIKRFRESWTNACTAAGVPGRFVHDLRRSAARNFVRAGIPERVAMQLTGHKTRSIFDRYAIVADGDLRLAATLLDASAPPIPRRTTNE